MQHLLTRMPDQTFRNTCSIALRPPVLQFNNNRTWSRGVPPEKHDITARGGPWELVLEGNVAFALFEMNMDARELRVLKRLGKRW